MNVPRSRRFALVALCSLFALSPVVASDSSLLAFVPKAERALAVKRFAAVRDLSSALRSDYEKALAQERRSADRARILEAAFELSRGGASPDSLKLALHLADIQVLPIEGLAEELSKERVRRFAAASALSSGRYGSSTSTESALVPAGTLLVKSLLPHLAKASRPQLEALAAALESRIALVPGCPRAAFSSLASSSRALPSAELRLWILALCPSNPDTLSSWNASASIQRGEKSAAFLSSFATYRTSYLALKGLSDLWSGAAGASWYVDAVANGVKSGHPLLKSPSPEALAALSRAVKLLPDAWPAVADSDLSPAFAELSSILWALRVRADPAYGETGIPFSDVDRAVTAIWARSEEGGAPRPSARTSRLAALERADAAQSLLAACRTDRELFAALAPLSADIEAFRLLHESSRYADIRKRLSSAYEAAITRATVRARDAVIKSGFGESLGRLVSSPGASTDGGIVFTLHTAGVDPFMPLVFTGAIELTRSDDVHFTVPVPLELYAKAALSELGGDIQALCVLPALLDGGPVSPAEMAWIAAGNALASASGPRGTELMRAVARRTGIPFDFVKDLEPSTAIALLCSGPSRLLSLPEGAAK